MKVTKQWLLKNCACSAGVEWWDSHKISSISELLRKCGEDDHLDYFTWIIRRTFNKEQSVKLTIFCATYSTKCAAYCVDCATSAATDADAAYFASRAIYAANLINNNYREFKNNIIDKAIKIYQN